VIDSNNTAVPGESVPTKHVVWQLLATVDSGTVVAGSSTVRFDLPRRAAVPLGLGGFVFHVVFGKAYSLIPSYFERQLATHRLLPVHFSLTTLGVAGLAGESLLVLTGRGLELVGVVSAGYLVVDVAAE
jgi:hypothetical protein